MFLIEPYHYFKCTAEINNAAGKGVGGGDDSGTGDDDNHLNHARSVLKVRMNLKLITNHLDMGMHDSLAVDMVLAD